MVADAELAEEVGARGLQSVLALGAAADGGQELVHLRFGEPDAGVRHAQFAVPGVQPHGRRGVRLLGAPGGDRVHGVLQQFAQVHLGAGVEVVGEQVDETAAR